MNQVFSFDNYTRDAPGKDKKLNYIKFRSIGGRLEECVYFQTPERTKEAVHKLLRKMNGVIRLVDTLSDIPMATVVDKE
jgi:hypothetical protein